MATKRNLRSSSKSPFPPIYKIVDTKDSIKVLIINLKRRPDRLENVIHLKWNGMNVTRIEAVDGRDLQWSSPPIDSFVTARAVRDATNAEKRNIATVDDTIDSFSPHLTLGAVACALSHRKAWETVISDNRSCLVIEDDVFDISPDIHSSVHRILDSLPKNADICFVGHHMTNAVLANEKRPFEFKKKDETCPPIVTGLFSYIVTPKGARKLLKVTTTLSTQLDVQISNHSHELEVFIPVRRRSNTPCLVLAPESQESDVQTYVSNGFVSHDSLPKTLERNIL
ncbi:MAG: glycosyltransferase family 25 protein [Rhodothermaceae bacterium TMED105]|mgnify:CR=1 FL=1|nr:MAG: glycosyltransferase family 25 protein [Rhodothermaceae bacterium TMED105]RPF82667.1 MAG: glycosyltransferase family 25 protein [Rhodothermaceae bacterium TMED105]|tara:strand:- start:14353 stop:15201 length:849 start_codon:yes stop_codon:yes gene_type:complete